MENSQLPNIILIVMDSAGAKRCSAYGHQRPTTPGMERIAAAGVLYKYCFTPAPWTVPSHASLFSGLYPSAHGCNAYDGNFSLPENAYNLPQILQQLGYHTVCITSNTLLNLRQNFDDFFNLESLIQSQRFEEARIAFQAFAKQSKNELARLKFQISYSLRNKYYSLLVENILDRIYRQLWGDISWSSCHATEKSLKIIKKLMKQYHNTQPLFIFVNLMETHWRFNPPRKFNQIINLNKKEKRELFQFEQIDFFIKDVSPLQRERVTLLYEQELAYLDNRLLDLSLFLEKHGLQDQTLFIITADHGECLGEHDLWSHVFGLYNELLHIPLIIKYPAALGLKGESRQLCQLHDLFATLMEVIDAPFPVPESSYSLLSRSRDFALAEHLEIPMGLEACRRRVPDFQPRDFMQPCRCIIDQNLQKLLQWADGRLELYDLERDFGEQTNLAEAPAHQSQKEYLQEKLGEFLGPFTPPPSAPSAD